MMEETRIDEMDGEKWNRRGSIDLGGQTAAE